MFRRIPIIFGSFVVLILISGGLVAGDEQRYISWDDLRVSDVERGRNISNGTRIIVVDQNGSGDSVTVQGAVDMVPHRNDQRVKIHILPGIYREKVFIQATKPYISFIGDDQGDPHTVITWHDRASDDDGNGNPIGTFRTATVTVDSDYFCATGLTFENSAASRVGDRGRQAVALRIAGDRAMFFRSRFVGSQDTLLDDKGSHYFFQCQIYGTIDFIFGTARSLYDRCVITSTAERYGAIAAHHRSSEEENTGFSFVQCWINGSGKVLLGRAWGSHSRTIYSFCWMEDVIAPEGWSDWEDPARQRTTEFGQFSCRGPGARSEGRVEWEKSLTYEEAKPFLDMEFIDGDQWLNL